MRQNPAECKFLLAETAEAFRTIAELADTIWRQHYTDIIGKAQVDYMLNKFQSVPAIAGQVSEGAQYYLVITDKRPAGYLAVVQRGEDLFLSKIYVLQEFRGRGLGSRAMAHIRSLAVDAGCDRITLTVNRDNVDSIAAYQRMGFILEGEAVKDIGGGFVMDDYKMSLNL